MKNILLCGDCAEKMRDLADNSVDAIVTDPPYGISFMGMDFDNPKRRVADMARTSDYVVCFRFPGDDWFIHHETNTHAKDKREAFDLAKARFPKIELLDVFQGIVMLYGAPYCTIDESIPRYKQTKPITFKHESRRRA